MYIVSTSRTGEFAKNMMTSSTMKGVGVERKVFPDGERYFRILEDLSGKEVAVVGNTNNDSEILELLFLLDAVREDNPSKLIAVIPYFGYARQHMIYKKGEAISAKVLISSISEYADEIVTVDIHDTSSYRYSKRKCRDFHASGSIADYFREKNIDLVMAPDDGAFFRAKEVADILGCKSGFMNKKRIDATTVEYNMDHIDASGMKVLLVDDIISTGGTILRSMEIIKNSGASAVFVSATHGLFINNVDRKIASECVELAVSDTIKSGYSKINVSRKLSYFITGD
ncbi:MAG: ribose-phosphate diphosphokinase [Candidatus Thermoplasmatota archaeon]|nr:ribose-phosphate diphosphokinase [Candidatus Thermoplasmatota archaeon]